MKTPLDPRHLIRKRAIKDLFSWSYQKKIPPKSDLAKNVIKNLKQIDKIISENAPEWPIQQINRIDLAILRLAIFELVIRQIEPPKVIIDEAVELAKSYGGKKCPSFINGVLGKILKNEKID